MSIRITSEIVIDYLEDGQVVEVICKKCGARAFLPSYCTYKEGVEAVSKDAITRGEGKWKLKNQA